MGLGHHLPHLDPARRNRLHPLREEALSDLRTTGLVKTYGATRALSGIDLCIRAGSVYGLVGPNGSGKTTALEILAGLRRPTAGTVDLGVDPKLVAYCPDAAEFEPWLSALETVDVAAGLIGRPQRRDVLVETLERVGLGHAVKRRVGGFSRGMRARLGLAAGLIGGPAILIADEPAAALDPAGKVEIIELLAGLSGSTTVLVSSHDLADVERICDDIGVLVDGALAYQGSLDHLLARATPALRIVVRAPADRLVVGLQDCPWVHSVTEAEPGVLTVGITETNAAESELPGLLVAAEVRLVEVRRAGVSLQDIFFELTATGPGHLPAPLAKP